MSYDRFQHSNFNEVFGELETAHRVRRGCFDYFGVPLVILYVLVFGVFMYLGSEDWKVIPVCVLPLLILFIGFIWHLFSTRGDELRIYENGFTVRSGRKLQICLWTEIKSYKHRERSHREVIELENGKFPLGSIEKKAGEIIAFDHDLPGTTEIIRRFENRKKKK